MKDKEVVQLNGKAFLYYSHKGMVLRLPTGIDWKNQNQPESQKVINSLVKKLRDIVSSYRIEFGSNPSRDFVRSKMKDESLQEKSCLMDYYKEFLSIKNTQVKNGNLKPQTLIDYTALKGAIIDFEKKSKTTFQLKDVSEDFINKFKGYFLSTRKMNNNSVKKRLKTFKIFLNYCESKKYFKIDFDYTSIKVKSYDPTIVSISNEEFNHLKNWNAGKYDKVKDSLIFQCLSSLRHSDVKLLKKHHIINDQIVIKSKKTDIQHIIPLTSTSRQILEKYDYNLNFFTTQIYNRLLKDMCRESGIFNSEVVLLEQKGNQKIDVKKMKWECIESHSGRRTWISRAISKGVPINVVMGICGLKTMNSVNRYMDTFGPVSGYSKLLEE